jgi:ABC-type sugar transport system permease subunit
MVIVAIYAKNQSARKEIWRALLFLIILLPAVHAALGAEIMWNAPYKADRSTGYRFTG